ncbi:MAG: flagellar protein FliT [Burkholderiaceae bacterium]
MNAAEQDAPPAADASATLERYRQIERVTQRMLAAAQADDWERVRCCEQEVQALADLLGDAAQHQLRDAAERRERLQILRRVLQLDGTIRSLAQPWQGRLDALLAYGGEAPQRPQDRH